MRSPNSSEIREGTRKDGKQHEGEEGQEDNARMLSVQSDGGAFQLNCKLKRIFYSSASREAWENGKCTWHQDASEDRKKRWTSENCFETFPRSES
ncbi:hypothetical protein G5I_00126 [Acromyrmex echinatior]|uniref:Uncharacterized protein n=1 Tax=Acromyrmex echinatior TaxID=103372 RepID=F4W421_ACREC|nr:hypothetical protein G5I_00126 [Acromyrmex echinatior]